MAKIKNAPNTGGLLPQDYTDFNAWIDYWSGKLTNRPLKEVLFQGVYELSEII